MAIGRLALAAVHGQNPAVVVSVRTKRSGLSRAAQVLGRSTADTGVGRYIGRGVGHGGPTLRLAVADGRAVPPRLEERCG